MGRRQTWWGAPPQERAKLIEHDEQGEDCHGNFKEDNECSKRRHYTLSLVLWTLPKTLGAAVSESRQVIGLTAVKIL